MRRGLALCMVFCLLLPGFLSAQERWLRGKVVRPGEHEEKIPEVNITVALVTGDTGKTNSLGVFRIFLKDIFKAGEKVTLVIDKPGWRIRYPLEGEALIPADLDQEFVEVQLLPVGSKLFWTHDRIEKLVSDMAAQSKRQVTLEGRPETIDFSRYIKDWSVKYGFSAQQAKEEIDQWIASIEATQNDLHKLGLAAFAKKNFGEASQLFNESAESHAKQLEDIREKVVRDFRLAGDADSNNYQFDRALSSYDRALTYVSRLQTPQLWATTLIDIGGANRELGIRAEGRAIGQYLSAAITAYRQALEVYTRAQLPQDWAMTQNNLGNVLRDQGTRTSGEAGARLLAEAVTAYRQALEVRTRTQLPQQWAQTQANLARAYIDLEDWAHAATSYANVLAVYPGDKQAYDTASYHFHETLFEFSQAFALNQQWLEQHPEDLAALSDFAEKHFTTGRFIECEQRIALLLANPTVKPSTAMALRAIQIANSLALGNTDLIPARIDALVESIAAQPENFKIDWSFHGTIYSISNNGTLTSYRPWLLQLFDAIAGVDRHAILSALRGVRASLPVAVKR